MKADAVAALERVRRESSRRLESRRAGRTRVAVQVSHCSQSVGAEEVADALSACLPSSSYLVQAGCDGACFEAPKIVATDAAGGVRRLTNVGAEDAASVLAGPQAPGSTRTEDFHSRQHRTALEGCGEMDAEDIDDYIARGGYEGLARALSITPEAVVEEVKESGLRGRGGAYFPAGMKWESARGVSADKRYVVVNSEEGEPGIFKDRHLMEGVPHRIVEGAIIAAYATGGAEAYIYINAEAELSAQRMQMALEQATELGLLGGDILGSGFGLAMEVRRGAGGYVCGEETTLLNTMEGYRREPRLRPPFPTEAGLWAKPTVINNAETLASVPCIMARGASAFRQTGTDDAPGTKLISLSGSVQRPGVVEVPMGTTLRDIIEGIGRGPVPGQALTGAAVGGPSSGVLPESMLDTPIAPGRLHETGVMLGAGGVIALDGRTEMLEVVRRLAAYNAAESCGKCTPCREGTPRIVEALDRIASNGGSVGDLDELRYLARVVGAASLCGLGQAAGTPVSSVLHFFGDELKVVG